jgi:type IV secretory pathway VirB9-like protein
VAANEMTRTTFKMQNRFSIPLSIVLTAGCAFAAVKTDPTPGEPLVLTMGQRKPVRIRVAFNQATLIRLPDGQRVMNVYGGDKGEGGLWSVDAGKAPTRFLAIKPKEKGIHTTLHVISNTGEEISFFLEEVSGVDSQFDGEVDANSEGATAETDVKWVPAEEAMSCKIRAASLVDELAQAAKKTQNEIAEAAKKAQAEADAKFVEYQAQYPRKLFFGYKWDAAKAKQLGLEAAWSDDKFTYFRGSRVLALYEINEDGKSSLIQYSFANGLYTVPKLLYDGYFAIGAKKENKLTFHRERSKP